MTNDEKYLKNIIDYVPRYHGNLKLSIWHKLPVARRSSVFILLFLGRLGELRVVLTKRSSRLRNFPGHISLPGGKADSGLESEWQVARREMYEEIGIHSNNDILLKDFGFTIEHLKLLPTYLSRTFSGVSPCVGFMKFDKHLSDAELAKKLTINLNPEESSNIFSCPLRDFLYPIEKEVSSERIDQSSQKIKWGGIPWNLRSYIFHQTNDTEVDWLKDIVDLSSTSSEEILDEEFVSHTPSKKHLSAWGRLGSRRDSTTHEKIYDVWGLTANILHDLSEIAYLNGSEREIGEEELIYSIWTHANLMHSKERSEEEKKLIHSNSTPGELGFNDILPRTEFNRLKQIYKL